MFSLCSVFLFLLLSFCICFFKRQQQLSPLLYSPFVGVHNGRKQSHTLQATQLTIKQSANRKVCNQTDRLLSKEAQTQTRRQACKKPAGICRQTSKAEKVRRPDCDKSDGSLRCLHTQEREMCVCLCVTMVVLRCHQQCINSSDKLVVVVNVCLGQTSLANAAHGSAGIGMPASLLPAVVSAEGLLLLALSRSSATRCLSLTQIYRIPPLRSFFRYISLGIL